MAPTRKESWRAKAIVGTAGAAAMGVGGAASGVVMTNPLADVTLDITDGIGGISQLVEIDFNGDGSNDFQADIFDQTPGGILDSSVFVDFVAIGTGASFAFIGGTNGIVGYGPGQTVTFGFSNLEVGMYPLTFTRTYTPGTGLGVTSTITTKIPKTFLGVTFQSLLGYLSLEIEEVPDAGAPEGIRHLLHIGDATWETNPVNPLHTPDPVPGDADQDGDVDLDDFDMLSLFYFNVGPAEPLYGDFSDDGQTNMDDFAIQALNFGAGGPDESAATLPEPASLALIAAGAVGFLSRRRDSDRH